MKKFLLILLCTVVLDTALVRAQLTSAEERIKEALDKCMQRVSNGQADDGFSMLFKEFWKEKGTVGQATMAMQRQYRNLIGRADDALGASVPGGYEFVGLKRLGSSVVRLVYLQKNELAFLPWTFSFYKPDKEWRLTHISFPDLTSDDIKDLTVTVVVPLSR